MKNPLASELSNSFGLLVARLPLGIVLALAGYMKFKAGVPEFVEMNLSSAEQFLSPKLASFYLHALPYAEVVLGSLLVFGLLTRLSGLLSALLLFSFGVAAGGFEGFFNSEAEIKASELFRAPAIYGVLALVALFSGPGRISLDGLLFGRGKAKVKARDRY